MFQLNSILLQANASEGNPWSGILMIGAMVVIFYFFMIRPQQRQQKKLRQAREAMTKGDRVVTAGGIHGKIKEIKDATLEIEIAPNVVIVVEKTSVQPVVEASAKTTDKK